MIGLFETKLERSAGYESVKDVIKDFYDYLINEAEANTDEDYNFWRNDEIVLKIENPQIREALAGLYVDKLVSSSLEMGEALRPVYFGIMVYRSKFGSITVEFSADKVCPYKDEDGEVYDDEYEAITIFEERYIKYGDKLFTMIE